MSESHTLDIMHVASGDLWAGAEAQLFTLALSLQRLQEANVIVVLLNHGMLEQQLHDSGIHVIVIDESRLNGLQILRKLMNLIRRYNPDIVHTHRFKENILGSIAAFLVARTPCIRTVHGAPEQDVPWRQFVKLTIMYADRFCGTFLQQKIIAVSDDLAARLAKSLPTEKIRVIENGIDLSELNLKRTFRKTSSNFRFGFAGRLVHVKRADLFIRSAKHLLDHHPDFEASYHVFGDGPLMAEMINLSRELGTENIVHFEGHCDEIGRAFDEIDILVMTSDHEGLPMILLEAMSSCVPIVAHATGGIPKLLEHGACGILVHEHSPSAYANAVYQLAINTDQCEQLANHAFLRVQSHYSSTQNALAYLAEYRQLSATRSKPALPLDSES